MLSKIMKGSDQLVTGCLDQSSFNRVLGTDARS